ncbi:MULTISPECIES: hypothetical protein [Micrococcaceae]|uniref:Lipoprotein n=1 Tax=Pseudarthrobacter siccitolerans TaxID=861266 RepID=A0ABU0PQA3_9MICC|nr:MULTISPECIES: hypothetical protein [Micrococcaceae]MDQ0676148.1 hypothetical protein [Pseudarthrobacter siccitolerans]MDQ0692084.1 hypothetical protein [Arthrobacter sp. W4I7]
MLGRPAPIGPTIKLPRIDRRPRPGLAACLAAGLGALAVLTGCSGTGSTLSTAVEDSASAIATARLALSLDAAGKLTGAATSTALDDALKELATSRNSVLKLSPASEEDRQSVQEALSVLDACTSSLTTARDAVNGGDGGPSLSDGAPSLSDGGQQLSEAADRLSQLSAKDGGK